MLAGTPLPFGSDDPCFLAFDLPCFDGPELLGELLNDGPGWLDGFWFFAGCFGFGVGEEPDPEVVVEEELEPEPELEPDPGLLVRVGDELEVVVVVLVELDELDVVGAQDSLSDCTTPCTGRFSAEIGVPAGALT